MEIASSEAEEHAFRHHPLLGTVVEVRVAGGSEREARRIDAVAVAEISRLERIFSAYDPGSELSRWKRDEVSDPSPELCYVMRLALAYQLESAGAFNPAAGVLSRLWKEAEASQEEPGPDVLVAAAASIREPRYEIDADGRPARQGDCSDLNLNARAKGWIVDRAVDAIGRVAVDGVTVNGGGDLMHRGETPIRVGIENPLRPYDNEPPIATVVLHNGGLATSGRARRGFRVGGRWFAHVVDPRTGRPVNEVASVSVAVADAATADVVATIVGVLPPVDAVAEADRRGVACLVVDDHGDRFANDRWRTISEG
jgi:thiamine biosynthesis lipoprotein